MYYIPKLPTELASLRRGSEHLGNTTLFTPIFKEKMWKIWAYLGKKLNGWSHKLETLHEDNLGPVLKKTRK